jgi:CBS domain-containing protein
MKASEFMTKNVISCKESQTVSEAAKLMTEKGFSVLPITNDSGDLVGIVTESDFVGRDVKVPHALARLKRTLGENHYKGNIEEIYERAKKRALSEVMSKNPVTVDHEDSLTTIVNIMSARNLKRIPVLQNGKVVGIITRKDLIKAFNQIGNS